MSILEKFDKKGKSKPKLRIEPTPDDIIGWLVPPGEEPGEETLPSGLDGSDEILVDLQAALKAQEAAKPPEQNFDPSAAEERDLHKDHPGEETAGAVGGEVAVVDASNSPIVTSRHPQHAAPSESNISTATRDLGTVNPIVDFILSRDETVGSKIGWLRGEIKREGGEGLEAIRINLAIDYQSGTRSPAHKEALNTMQALANTAQEEGYEVYCKKPVDGLPPERSRYPSVALNTANAREVSAGSGVPKLPHLQVTLTGNQQKIDELQEALMGVSMDQESTAPSKNYTVPHWSNVAKKIEKTATQSR